MKKPLFTGVCTALVTPFLENRVNYPMMDMLLRRQMDAGINAVVVAGTTGEAPTLSDDEKRELIQRAKDFAGDGCAIIAGTGSNSTEHAISLSQDAEDAGADGVLVVSPYYNKATPDGLLAHYTAIAHSVSIPIILYNVPSRTGVDIPVSVYRRLSAIPNIVGVKEAASDITKITRIRKVCPQDFTVWSGNDEQIVPAMALGAKGVVSVLSNLCPVETRLMADAALDGDFDTASALQVELMGLIDLLFCEVNPIPIKEAMGLIGYDCGHCRLPLTSLTRENRKKLMEYLKK
jgi:4-hydroxy-tetrahydrodipicolinate synthase